jgi:hypothetical protein
MMFHASSLRLGIKKSKHVYCLLLTDSHVSANLTPSEQRRRKLSGMDITKIKTKIGEFEFEAEGPVETVAAQFQAFREIVSNLGVANKDTVVSPGNNQSMNQTDIVGGTHVEVSKILRVAGRVVSLTALPQSNDDAALLIMLGQRDLRNNDAVTGQEIGDGLAQSGRPVPRVDRVMERAITAAYVLKSGIKRSTRYRLTNVGLVRALNLAQGLIESLP